MEEGRPVFVFVANRDFADDRNETRDFVDSADQVMRFNGAVGFGGKTGSKTTIYSHFNAAHAAPMALIRKRNPLVRVLHIDHDVAYRTDPPLRRKDSKAWPSSGYAALVWAMQQPEYAGHDFVMLNFTHHMDDSCGGHDWSGERDQFEKWATEGKIRYRFSGGVAPAPRGVAPAPRQN